MSKHTPEPWYYRESRRGGEYVVYALQDGKEHLITHGGCGCCNADDDSIESEDDARLMAVAPKLLAMLEEVLAAGVWPDLHNRVHSVVAEARGEA